MLKYDSLLPCVSDGVTIEVIVRRMVNAAYTFNQNRWIIWSLTIFCRAMGSASISSVMTGVGCYAGNFRYTGDLESSTLASPHRTSVQHRRLLLRAAAGWALRATSGRYGNGPRGICLQCLCIVIGACDPRIWDPEKDRTLWRKSERMEEKIIETTKSLAASRRWTGSA